MSPPNGWVIKCSAPVRGRSGLGGPPRHAIWTPGRPRGTKLCGRAAGQEGQTQTAPPHQARPSQLVGTIGPAPRPAGPALRALVMSCQSPGGPCGDITSEVSPAAAAPHPGPLTSEENPALPRLPWPWPPVRLPTRLGLPEGPYAPPPSSVSLSLPPSLHTHRDLHTKSSAMLL